MHIGPLNETFSCLFLWFKIINTSATEMMFLHRIEPCVAVRSMTDNSTFFTLIAVNGSKDLTTSITVIILALLNLQIINFFKSEASLSVRASSLSDSDSDSESTIESTSSLLSTFSSISSMIRLFSLCFYWQRLKLQYVSYLHLSESSCLNIHPRSSYGHIFPLFLYWICLFRFYVFF